MGIGVHMADAPRRRELQLRRDRMRLLMNNTLFVVVALLAAYTCFYTYQVWKQETLLKQQEVERVRAEIAQVQSRNQELKSKIGFMQTPAGVEKMAREHLGLVRPNETTYLVVNGNRLPDPPAAAAPRPQAAPMSFPHRLVHWFHVLWNGGD